MARTEVQLARSHPAPAPRSSQAPSRERDRPLPDPCRGRASAGPRTGECGRQHAQDQAWAGRRQHLRGGATPARLPYSARLHQLCDGYDAPPPFITTFTNGILSTQFLLKVLSEDGAIKPGELEDHLRKPGDWLRRYLSGDVLTVITAFFAQEGGRFHAALYELEDEELEDLLAANAERLSLILSDAGSRSPRKHKAEGEDEEDDIRTDGADEAEGKTVYDARNAKARATLRALADRPGTAFEMQDRFFNGSGHIGHNKFVVFVDDAGTPRSVLTGSTNWTWSGVAGQSNNCIRIDNSQIAAAYLAYWKALRRDEQPVPEPPGSRAVGAVQGDDLKKANRSPVPPVTVGSTTMEVRFSPNVPGKSQPPTAKAIKPSRPPPDMDRLFSLVRRAKQAILFLVFMPSRGGLHSIVSEAIALGLKDTSLNVVGAISDTQAMWGYEASHQGEDGRKVPAWSPHTFAQAGVSVVRATALTDREIGRQLGDFQIDEKLTVGRAIIHDKVVVIDPLDPDRCAVAFGSHNLGYKASYANDENLMIVRGHQPLAEAYAAHVLDVYDHYRFRAVEAERAAGRGNEEARWDGFLKTDGSWQASASRRLSDYFTG
ncbi:phospholipase D-like domain-containing protein [Methylobacterium tardum]|uniref:phospholipase D-like domain-containing protein n=1 Tax=Methylobacterium tardum TaxID=374432 RepID=UPI0020208B2E|nr:phospholipase D-like domain-containing protein [Methylobacterium tardum]URD35160.1 phospholipase D-like domain-containing protein [Methylobacterium tardum]